MIFCFEVRAITNRGQLRHRTKVSEAGSYVGGYGSCMKWLAVTLLWIRCYKGWGFYQTVFVILAAKAAGGC
ncbi:hypothetical protein [Nostoc sp. C110]|uniref:hypothetical protein n=1 Tax=Nostoc sp. C110 TaxID=3349876 RepID=UPI00370D7A94